MRSTLTKARHTRSFAIDFLSVYDECARDSHDCAQAPGGAAAWAKEGRSGGYSGLAAALPANVHLLTSQANLPFPLPSVAFTCSHPLREARHTCPFAIDFLSVYDKCARDY